MSDELIEIRIPMIVTSDGKWAAQGSHRSVDDADWSGIDEMCDYDAPTINPQRYWITVYVKAPKIGELAGAAIPAGERT